MTSASNFLLFAGLVLFAIIHGGSCLKCYECVQEVNQNCVNSAGVKNAYVDCGATQVCYNHLVISPDLLQGNVNANSSPASVRKGCGNTDYCTRAQGICLTCTKDYCNSSTRIAIPTFSILFALALKYLF